MLNGVAAIATSVLLMSAAGVASAQQGYPNRPITVVVAFAAGGPADTVTRAVAPAVQAALGQPVVVENRPGANGKLAMQAMLRAPRDGYTFGYISPSIMSIAPVVEKDLGYDTTKDIIPLTTAIRSSNVITVHPSLNVKTLPDLVTWAKANPGKLNYGSIGTGSWYHLATEKLLAGLGIEATHVPYKGEAPAVSDMIGGNIQMMILSGLGKPVIDEGKVVPLASTGKQIAFYSPKSIPVSESGIPALANYDETPWVGFGIGAGTPPDIVNKLHATLVAALNSEDVKKRLAVFGDTQTTSIAEMTQLVAEELAANRTLVESGRVKLDATN